MIDTLVKPVKILHDKRLAYLVALEESYRDMGYTTKLNGRDNLLEIYQKGTAIPKTQEEVTIEKWIS